MARLPGCCWDALVSTSWCHLSFPSPAPFLVARENRASLAVNGSNARPRSVRCFAVFSLDLQQAKLSSEGVNGTLQLDAQPLGNAVYKIHIGDNKVYLKDCPVAEIMFVELPDIFFTNGLRPDGQFDGVFHHCHFSGREVGGGWFSDQGVNQSLVPGEAEQTCSVMAHSVFTVVGGGNTYRDHFALRPAKFSRRMHDGLVKRQMGREHMRRKAVDFQNVRQLARRTLLRFVNSLQLTVSVGFFDCFYPGHHFPLN